MNGETLIWIYLMRDLDTGFHKIGKSKDPNGRLYQLTKQDTKQPTVNNYEIVEAWWTTERTESEMHVRFHQRRVRGEWFDLNEEDLETIRMLMMPFQPYSQVGNPNAYDSRIDAIAKLASESGQKVHRLEARIDQLLRRILELEKALGIKAFEPFNPANLPKHFRREPFDRLKDTPSLKPRPQHTASDDDDLKF